MDKFSMSGFWPSLCRKIEELETENNALKKEIAEVKEELRYVQGVAGDFMSDDRRLQKEIESLKKQLESLKLYAELGEYTYKMYLAVPIGVRDDYMKKFMELINQIQESEAGKPIICPYCGSNRTQKELNKSKSLGLDYTCLECEHEFDESEANNAR